MKMPTIVAATTLFALSSLVSFQVGRTAGADGTAVFERLGCGHCHKALGQGAAPTLAAISRAYEGDREKIIRFFTGKEKSIFRPESSGKMTERMGMIQALSDEDKAALAGYILRSE